jgi:tetratricopeptide (TPR) repeat protein
MAKGGIVFSDTTFKNINIIKIPLLNPRERITFSYLTNANIESDELPDISVRAKGINGKVKEKSENSKINSTLNLITTIAGFIAVILTFLASTLFKNLFSKSEEKDLNIHLDSGQIKVIAYLCSTLGLKEEFERYSDLKAQSTYWSEADFIAYKASLDNDIERNNKRIKLLIGIIDYADKYISKSSIAIIYFNIGKIFIIIGDKVNAEEYLKKAEKIFPTIIKKRINIDPIINKYKNHS